MRKTPKLSSIFSPRTRRRHAIGKAAKVSAAVAVKAREDARVPGFRRSVDEVVKRAVALFIYASVAMERNYEAIPAVTDHFGAEGFFSPIERRFLDGSDRDEQDRINAVWKIECAHVLLWALGFLPEVGRPDEICDVSAIGAVVMGQRDTEGLLAKAELRPQEEIEVAAAAMHRFHWEERDAWLRGEPPPSGFVPGIAMERHYALNWLIGYSGPEWDDIATDT